MWARRIAKHLSSRLQYTRADGTHEGPNSGSHSRNGERVRSSMELRHAEPALQQSPSLCLKWRFAKAEGRKSWSKSYLFGTVGWWKIVRGSANRAAKEGRDNGGRDDYFVVVGESAGTAAIN